MFLMFLGEFFWCHSLSIRPAHPCTPYWRSKLQKQTHMNSFCIMGKNYCIMANIRCTTGNILCITVDILLLWTTTFVLRGRVRGLWRTSVVVQGTFFYYREQAQWRTLFVFWGSICGLWGKSVVP